MAAPTRTPPDKWIEEGLRALAAGGPDAVRVEALARALGVTKGGFYNHFDDRPALLDEMLDTWERLVIDQVIERVEAGGGDARAKLRRLFALGSSSALKIELAIRDWARRDTAVARRLRRIDNRRMDYLRSLFGEFCSDEQEVEVRSLLVMSLFIGTPLLAADLGPGRRRDLVNLAQERLLET
jgi:AcrR family transcriptional regulator